MSVSRNTSVAVTNQAVKIEYALTKTSAYQEWWPCRILNNSSEASFGFEVCVGFEHVYFKHRKYSVHTQEECVSSPLFNCIENVASMHATNGVSVPAPSVAKRLSFFSSTGNVNVNNNANKLIPNCLIQLPYIQVRVICMTIPLYIYILYIVAACLSSYRICAVNENLFACWKWLWCP